MGVVSGLLDLLFPPKCMFCRTILPGGSGACCKGCEVRLKGQETASEGTFVTTCWAALSYEGAVREAIIRYKFQGDQGYATEFGRLLGRCIAARLAGQYDLITWVPVSRKRYRERGYDQAMLLSCAAALELGDVAVSTLRKTVDNPAQSGLTDRSERKRNVRGAYTVAEPELVKNRRILLIDDIVTTGSTMEEAGRTLLEGGAKTVVGAALARPPETTKEDNEGLV